MAGAGAFFEGLAGGAAQGIQLNQRQQQIELQKQAAAASARQADLKMAEFIIDLAKPGQDPAMLEFKLDTFASSQGPEFAKSDKFKNLRKFAVKANDDTRQAILDSMEKLLPDAKPGEIQAFTGAVLSGNFEALKPVFDMIDRNRRTKMLEAQGERAQEGLELQREGLGLEERRTAATEARVDIERGEAAREAETQRLLRDLFAPTIGEDAAPSPAGEPGVSGAPAPSPSRGAAPTGGPTRTRANLQRLTGVARNLIGLGMTKEANSVLSLIRTQVATDPTLKREEALNEPLSPTELQAFPGAKAGSSLADVMGLEPRSPEEEAAAKESAKVSAKTQAERAQPIDPATGAFLKRSNPGFDPKISVSDAVDQGVVPKLDPTTMRALTIGKATVSKSARTASEIVKLMEGKPEVLSAVGGLTRVTNSLFQQARGLVNVAGYKFFKGNEEVSMREVLDPNNYLDKFRELGIENAQLQSATINLAFSLAAASGQDNRSVSDRDVERFITEIGVSGDPKQFAGAVRSAVSRMEFGFREHYKAATGLTPEGASTLQGDLPGMSNDEIGALRLPLLSDEDYQALKAELDKRIQAQGGQ